MKALIRRDGDPAGEIALKYGGATGRFEGIVTADRPGVYEASVYAYDPTNGNTGVDFVTFIVSE